MGGSGWVNMLSCQVERARRLLVEAHDLLQSQPSPETVILQRVRNDHGFVNTFTWTFLRKDLTEADIAILRSYATNRSCPLVANEFGRVAKKAIRIDRWPIADMIEQTRISVFIQFFA